MQNDRQAQPIEFRETVTAELLDVDGSETRIAARARVSTQRNLLGVERAEQQARDEGLLRSLVRERHGSPFESSQMTWAIEAPIFVAREAVRHRLSNWNEESGRYVELRPVFYLPPQHRHLKKVEGSKQMAYATEAGTFEEWEEVYDRIRTMSVECWDAYQASLRDDILKEVARFVLPLNIMTHWHWTMNIRALTNALSLRVRSTDSHIESKPQIEIQWLAEQMEEDFATHFPVVHAQWSESGRLPL